MTTPRPTGQERSSGHQRPSGQQHNGPGYVPLGRYAHVPVRAHWSVLFILALLTMVLARNALPSALTGQPALAYWLVAAGASVAFLVALLGHELAHAIAARHFGVPVKQITVWMLGGQTELDGEPPTPKAEAVIAGAGPTTSLGFGGLFLGLAWLLPGPALIVVALVWLSVVSVVLAVFNLLPGAPLDGGRLLRAAVWHRHRDRTRAIVAGARAGSVLGVVLVALGVVQVVTGSVLGLWLAVIGWFIFGAATAERHAASALRLRGHVVREFMRVPPVTAPSWWTVAAFLAHPDYTDQHAFPLVDFEGNPQNVLFARELRRVPLRMRDEVRLRDVARGRRSVQAVDPETPVEQVVVPMRLGGGVAVVVEDGRIVGTLSERELDAALTPTAPVAAASVTSASSLASVAAEYPVPPGDHRTRSRQTSIAASDAAAR